MMSIKFKHSDTIWIVMELHLGQLTSSWLCMHVAVQMVQQCYISIQGCIAKYSAHVCHFMQ